MTNREDDLDHPAWPARVWLLLGLGAALGLAFHLLIGGDKPWSETDDPQRVAGAALVGVSGIAFAFSLERLRWAWSAGFALTAGLLAGAVALWNGSPSAWGDNEGWQFASSIAAMAIAMPLFQAMRDSGRRAIPVGAVHAYAWADAILVAAAFAFVLATFLLTVLLGALFKLIGIRLLADLMETGWFFWMLAGAALGAAVGILRDRDSVLGALQRVVRAVLSFLAPVLALGLVLFVLALPFTGLQPLWEQTKATTPILLACVAGALLLANAVIGNSAQEEPDARPLRWAAAALAVVLLPLAAVAAVSTARRIGQYGYTPERLWAAVLVAAALAAALAYCAALVRGRAHWPRSVRRANFGLAAGSCALALFLATPIVSFGTLSARDQVARLESGKVAPEKFDWAALRFDFGPAGRQALQRLSRAAADPRTRTFAAKALAAKSRDWALEIPAQAAAGEPAPLKLRTGRGPVPEGLRSFLYQGADGDPCRGAGECLLFWKPGERTAVALLDGCAASVVGRAHQASRDTGCSIRLTVAVEKDGTWREAPPARDFVEPADGLNSARDVEGIRREREAIERGDVVVGEIRHRQVFIGGKPAARPFE